MALKTIDRVLRSDFGFRDILWVFSGRRGIHCWVCDPMARSMQDSVRAAIANYLEVTLQPILQQLRRTEWAGMHK